MSVSGKSGNVLAPATYNELSAQFEQLKAEKVRIIPIGQGSSIKKACQNKDSGVFISAKNLNDIVDLARENLTVTVQSGITLRKLDEVLKPHGLVLVRSPLLTSDRTIGGVVAEAPFYNKEFANTVLGLKAIVSSGDYIKTGGKTVKNASGYDLRSLFIGSKGNLGMITEITLKLQPVKACRELIISNIPDHRINSLLKLLLPFKHYFTFLILDNLSENEYEKNCSRLTICCEGSEEAVSYLRKLIKNVLMANILLYTSEEKIAKELTTLQYEAVPYEEYRWTGDLEFIEKWAQEGLCFLFDLKAKYLRVFNKGQGNNQILNNSGVVKLERYSLNDTFLRIKRTIEPDFFCGIN